MLRMIALGLTAAPLAAGMSARAPLPDWPPPGAGNSKIGDLNTSPTSDWGQSMMEKWDQAMNQVETLAPSTAAEIGSHIADGSIDIVNINAPSPASETDTPPAGASDRNTLGVDLVNRSTADVAGAIIHEWEHIKCANTDPNCDPDDPCQEAGAYAAQSDFLCAASCEATEGDAPTCDEMTRVGAAYDQMAAECEAAGGTPPATSSTVACNCS